MTTRTFRDVLTELNAGAQSTAEKGRSFERLVKAFLEWDKAQAQRFTRVWLWSDWPGNGGRHDTGIDIVAEERDGGNLVAIQCKFYGPSSRIVRDEANKFLTAYGTTEFASGIIVSTSDLWTGNAEDALRNRDKPVSRWGPDVFEKSSIDWQTFDLNRPADLIRRETKDLRDYQYTALHDTLTGFEEHGRGKLIMACGSGKTFTALRIAERVAGTGGTVLFLTPSISLLSQSSIDWANDADLPLKPFAVCSDTRAGKRSSDDEDISPYDLTETPSTDPEQLITRFNRANRQGNMTVVFSTYQSLNVVADAQKAGLPEFDLIICDEAHRTTGVSLVGKEESNFQRVHNNEFIASRKRLYMTATPRIFGDRARRKADESNLTSAIASMDDASIYGPEFHRLSFGQAVEMEILTPYKVVILNVEQEQVGIDLNKLLSADKSGVNMDNGTRMIGCWNGLGKRAAGVDFRDDPLPAKRAVAFSNIIKQSTLFEDYFPQVADSCIAAAGDNPENTLRCEVRHVDGTQDALKRANHLAWLRAEPDPGTCRVLSNARCLTEGIDVPALDAILFLHPRKSDIDVVQAVGRVMRKQEGKQFGYIIIPIAQAPGVTAEASISESAYKAVWQVINAISAHDDRFEAIINQFALSRNGGKSETGFSERNTIGCDDRSQTPTSEEEAIQGILQIAGSAELQDAILAKVVDKYADPGYWEKWAVNIREIAQRHEARIRALLNLPDTGVRPIFDEFLAGLRNNLNDGIAEDDAIGMLSQHLITRPVFDALFEDYAFAQHNPVSQAMQGMIDSLQERGLEKETEGLENFYRDVRIRARGVTTAEGKQQIIAELYERFLKLALPDTAANLGIVYTPTPVVDYIVRSVEDVLQREFDGASLSDEGVHVLDPFVGTGTFITRLLRSGIIKPHDLARKYASELHANEMQLLAYYIAAINIESTYHDLAEITEYQPFDGIVLTDTFQSYEPDDPMDAVLFPGNNRRIERQKGLDIRVIIGNPPWSATNNRAYETLDNRLKQAYVDHSSSRNVIAIYDPYVKAIRLASDRVQDSAEGGIVAFVTNGGFIESNAFDGFRKAVANEFDAIYCYNLRGDQRTSGEQSRKEAGKIFGSGSRAGVAILLLLNKPGPRDGDCQIYYHDIGDYLDRDAKLDILNKSRLANTEWQIITPNAAGDWIGQRSDTFQTLRPLSSDNRHSGESRNPETVAGSQIFNLRTPGLKTNRDAWCFNSSSMTVLSNVSRFVEDYNRLTAGFAKYNPDGGDLGRSETAKAFAAKTRLPLGREHHRDIANGKFYAVEETRITISSYRPFFKQWLYFNRSLNTEIRQFPEIYPERDSTNVGISITGPASNSHFHALLTDGIPESCLTAVNSIYLPRYRYVPAQALTRPLDPANPELERVSNINPQALAQFREHYASNAITEDDLFYYTYGVLHSEQYRETFAADLQKQAARIPMAASLADFHAFADAGRQLADLHVNYETVEPYPLDEIHPPGWNPDAPNAYRVEKMAYAGKRPNLDKSRIIYNAGITLAGIPEQAHRYVLGSRSALDWLIDRYQVKTDKASGIVNDPNDWCAEHNRPPYILDLVKRITTVSLRTVNIVNGLPGLV